MLANKQKIIPCARGVTAKARHKTSIYHKLEKTSMVIGVAGLLGGVIGPVIAPASEVLAVSRSQAKQGTMHPKLGQAQKAPTNPKAKSKKTSKKADKLDDKYPVPWGNGLDHKNALGENAGPNLTIGGWLTYRGAKSVKGLPFGGKTGKNGWQHATYKDKSGDHDIYVWERGTTGKTFDESTTTAWGNQYSHYEPNEKNGAGKIGMYYTGKDGNGAGNYYDIKTHKRKHVDFRITYMGGNDQHTNIRDSAMKNTKWSKGGKAGWTLKNGKRIVDNPKHGDGRYIAFSSQSLGVYDLGRGTDQFKLQIIDHKTKQPIKYNGPLTFWDIDYGQALKVSNSKAALYVANKTNGKDIGPQMVAEGLSGHFRGYIKGIITAQNKDRDPFSKQGTVDNTDPRGAYTAVVDGSEFLMNFDRFGQGKFNPTHDAAHDSTVGKIHSASSVPKVAKSRMKDGAFYGNWFNIKSNTNLAPAKAPVSSTGKRVGLKAPATGKGKKWNTADWQEKLSKPVKAGDKFYYAIQTRVDWGTSAYTAGDRAFSRGKNKVAYWSQNSFKDWKQRQQSLIKNFGFEDKLDKRLKLVGEPYVVVSQTETGPSVYKLSKNDFVIKHPKDPDGSTHVYVALRAGSPAALTGTNFSKSIANKFVRLIIPVEVQQNKTSFNLTSKQADKIINSAKDPKTAVNFKTTKNADGSITTTTTVNKEIHVHGKPKVDGVGNDYKGNAQDKLAVVRNVAIVTQNDQTLQTTSTWTRTIPGEKKQIQSKGQPTETKGVKDVFRQEPGTKSWLLGKSDSWDGQDVLPNQWLTYQTNFKVPDPKGAMASAGKKADFTKHKTEQEWHFVNGTFVPIPVSKDKVAKSKLKKIIFTDTLDSHLSKSSIKEGDELVKPFVGISTDGGRYEDVTSQAHVRGNKLQITIGPDSSLFDQLKNGANLYVRFRVRVKDFKNSNLPEEKVAIDNIANLETKVQQTTKKYKDGELEGEPTKKSYKLSAKTNKVTNYLTPRQSPPPIRKNLSYIKKVESHEENEVPSSLNPNDEVEYTIVQPLGTRGVDIGNNYNKIQLNDLIDPHLKVESVTVDSPIKGTKGVSESKRGTQVTWTADSNELNTYVANGGNIVMTIKVKYPPQKITKTTTSADNTAVSQTTIDNHTWPDMQSNTISTGLPPQPSETGKTLVSVYDETTREMQDPQSILNPKDDYRLTYAITATIGNADNSGFSVTDPMPENTTLDLGSINMSNSNGLSVNYGDSDKHELRATVSGGKDLIGSKVQLDYAVHVEHESDWSDYYTHKGEKGTLGGVMVYNNETDTVDANSYMRIPNTATIKFGDHTEDETDYFNMGVQLFDTQQVIVQDDDNWNTSLDKSHYVDHTRNDRSAVTTAIMIQVPNYLRINTLNVSNNFKEPMFEKGETHMLRANSDLVHDRSHLKNPDFTKSGFATSDPYLGEKPSDLQKMSGKTYWNFTKWSPETRYFKDYAKLKNMRDSFVGQVNFSGSSIGSRHVDLSDSDIAVPGKENVDLTGAKAAIPNSVGIHLSNIYAYYDMIDRATFGTGMKDTPDPNADYNKFDDGKKMDYNLYGEVKGLAVDNTQKTNFDSEKGGQPISAWLKTNGYDAGKKTLQLKNGLGQGETAPVVQTWTGLDADKLTGVATDHGYYSKSNTYRDTKLDPYLGTNPQLAEEKGHSVVLTNDKDGDDTLIPNRQDKTILWEKYKKNTINVGNHLYSNPKVFLDYFDFNKDFGGKTITRVLREAYELYAPKSQSGKAGQGMQEQHKLITFNYYNDLARNNTLANYQTTMTSPDKIFDNGYTTTSNAEVMDQNFVPKDDLLVVTKDDSNGMNMLDESAKKLADHKMQAGVDNNWGVDNLIDTQSAQKPLVKDHMAWASKNKLNVLPHMQLSTVNYRFNQRLLANGKQAYDMSKNAYPKSNANTADFTDAIAKSATVGGYRDYLKNNLSDGDKVLNYNSIGFGVGKATTVNFNQAIKIYGHRYLSKNKGSNSSSSDEIAIMPAFSNHANGKGGSKINGFGKKDNDFVNNNDPNASDWIDVK